LKQEKERAALQQQKKSLRVKEDIGESFSPSQIAALKAEYSKINGIDPASDTYKKLIAMLDRLDLKSLQSLAGAEIKFVSKLAQNRVMRKSMKKEAVDPYSLPNFKDLKSAIKHASDKVKTHRDQLDGIEIYKSRGGYDINHTSNSSGRDTTKKSGGKLLGIVYRNQKNDGIIYKNQYKNVIDKIKEEVEHIDELSTNKLADYKKKASDSASAADKAGDTKTGNKRFSGIMKATRKQFDNDAKKSVSEASQRVDSLVTDALKIMQGSELKDAVQALKTVLGDREYNGRRGFYNLYVKQLVDMYGKKANEELSPKQKQLDKNKNGKIDGSDLAKLRGEELSAKQKVLDKNKNGKIDGSDLAKLRKEETDLQEKSDYEVYHKDYSGAVQTAIKQAEKRGYEVDMDDWHDKVATGPKKPSSGKTNSFSINLMKDGKPSKKKLQMQVYNMDNHKYELNMYIEEVEIAEAGPGLWANIQAKRERIKAGSNERMRKPGEKGAPESDALDRARGKNEAASPAQQAAIAIAMKKDGKKPKMSESVVDKIKAIKRGLETRAKASDHFDKAGDPKNANASKDLKKAVRYTNLLNKEETEIVTEAKKKSFKDVKKKMKEEETPNKSSIKKGDMLTGKREPIEINPELKEPAR
jgi:hypothetical protein